MRAIGLRRIAGLHLLAQGPQFLLQLIYLLLLADHGAVQLVQQVFGKAEFGFDFGEAGFHIT